MKTVRLSLKVARRLLDLLRPCDDAAVAVLRAALKPRPVKPLRLANLKRKATKRADKNASTKAIREAVMRRASEGSGGVGACEMCGIIPTEPLEMDHFFGRRGPQSERTCWVLCRGCHREKTRNEPSAQRWLELFQDHCARHDYPAEHRMARNRLQALQLAKAAGGAK